jgi:geranylgeranyl diphosphate synthase, type I
MDAKITLAEFKRKVDSEIEVYFERVIAEARKKDAVTTEALKYVKKMILAGGKRLRPAFMYYGYLAAGGKDLPKIIKASISIELVHTFLLIHDDIIDRDFKRHGMDTVNLKYSKLAKTYFPKKDPLHFGNSIAIVVGDMVGAMGNQVIYESTFDPKLVVRALHKLQDIVSMTVIGETKDIYIEYTGKADEEEILKMYEYKTAKYTIEGPLHLGAILAGATDSILESFSEYAVPLGIAFQIQDDILGVFGDEEKLGKPVGSDIESGKQTLLVAKAMEKINRKQKNILESTLGKKNLTRNEIEDFRKVIRDTGSLDYAKNMSFDLINKGKKAIENEKMNKEAKDFLLGIAEYMVNREL